MLVLDGVVVKRLKRLNSDDDLDVPRDTHDSDGTYTGPDIFGHKWG